MTTIENREGLGVRRTRNKSSVSLENNISVSVPENSCTVTMMYLGPRMIKSNGPYKFKSHADEVLILQSYTVIGTKSVFKGCLKPNDEFSFKSHRLMDRHFNINIYINGILDQNVFVCCEKGFVDQSHFQTIRSSCQLESITGGIPCEACQSHQMMNFCSDEISYDDPNDSRPTSAQTSPFKLPTMLTKNMVEEQTVFKPVSGLLPMPKSDTTSPTYNQIEDISKAQTFTDKNEMENVDQEEVNQQYNQSIGTIQTPKDTKVELKQTDSTANSKIMNEDKKPTISPAASLRMEQLLFGYLQLLAPQTKPNQTAEKDKMISSTNNSESNNTTESLTYSSLQDSDRETKAKIQYTDSAPMSSTESKAESFVLIWLDQTIKKNQDTVESEQKLRAIVNSLVTYQTIDEAMRFIEQVHGQQIYLIVSGELGKQLLSMNQIVDSSKLNSIYIYCHDQLKYAELVHLSNKVRAVFVDIDPLCIRLKADAEQALKNLLPISTTSGSSADEENQVKFLCSQLHRDLLFTMEYNNNARVELVDFCSNIYKSSPTELKHIDELRAYHAGKAIWWYTRHTFLYKMLNTAFLKQDMSILYRFQFFIKDLHMQLEQMHSLYKPSLKSRIFSVYRGLNMPWEYFKTTIRDKITNLIAFDSFLSTSSDEKVAKQFALDKRDPTNESVVFCMEIDADRMERPFADISRWSHFKNEREVLFSIGTVFRIDHVAEEKTSDGIWLVRLSTVSEKDEKLQNGTEQIQITLLRFFEDVLHAQNDVKDHGKIPASNANVASMFYKQGEYEYSLQYYKQALEALENLGSPDPFTKATYISNVAKAHMALGHDNEALASYKDALDIRLDKCKDSNDPSLIHTLHTIGHIYRDKKNWNEALEQYKQALKLQLSSLEPRLLSDPSSIAATYVCIGNIFHRQEKYEKALESFSKALEQQYEHLSEQHPVLAFLYNNIGAMYYKMKRYDLALKNHLECLKIESKALPKEHRTFAATYKNIAETYEKRRQFDEAIEFAQKCIDQLKPYYSEDSTELKDAIDLLKMIQIRRDNTK